MKIPKKGPALLDLFTKVPADRLSEIIRTGPGPLVNGKYLHWDELRFRQPPSGLTHDEWWLLIRLARQGGARRVPLTDPTGRPFTYTLVDPIAQLLHETDLSAGGSIRMPVQVTNPDSRDQYYVRSLMEEAITSSQLEGATTTRQIAKEMLRSGRRPRDRSEQMILNNFVTMQKLRDIKGEPLSKDLVLDLHRTVTEDTLDDPSAAGRFRRPEENIAVTTMYDEVLHRPPPADQLEHRFRSLCAFANDAGSGFIHPVLRAIVLHFWLAYDHPFVDGNGRTARALFYWSMLRHGYWLVEFLSISQFLVKAPAKYGYAFLYTETDENDLTYFLLHQLDVFRRAIHELHEYIARKTRELRRLDSRLRNTELLNHRQRALITDALRHPGKPYLIEGHRVSHGVVYETARSDLRDLASRGLLRASKRGRTWVFVPVPDLDQRLEKLR